MPTPELPATHQSKIAQHRLPVEHEEGGYGTNVKQCHEHGGIPINTFYSTLSVTLDTNSPKYSLLVDRSYQDLLTLTFTPQG